MTRNKKIEIRLTESEDTYINDICNKHSMTKSEYIRKAITGNGVNTKDMAQHIFTMQKIVNKIDQTGATEEELDILSKEMEKLWRFLR